MFVNTISVKASSTPVMSATIFQSSTAELDGKNVIEISGLSRDVDPESPRITGASEGVHVVDVLCRRKPPGAPKMQDDEASIEIRSLESAIQGLRAERHIHQHELELIDDSARLVTTETHNASVDGQLLDFVKRCVKEKLAVKKEMQRVDSVIDELDKKLWLLRNARKGEATTEISVTLVAEQDCKANLKLTYLVSGVRWQPFYDLHAITADGQPSADVSLRYCATTSQSTGEDWSDTNLTLSTANSQAMQRLTVPSLDALKITQTTVSPHRMRAEVTGDVAEQARYSVSNSAPPVVPAAPERSALSVRYHVEGTVSLPSDGQNHKLTVATLDLKSTLNYECVPRKSQAAYIVCQVKNTSEYDLLAGPVHVFMNDSFVTKTSIGFIPGGESFGCVLGIDTSLKVSYRRDLKTEHEPRRNFAEPQKTTTCTVMTTIRNQHTFDIGELIVRDAIPLGNDDSQVAVSLRKPEGLAKSRDGEEISISLGDERTAKVRWTKVVDGKGGEKDGLYEWVCSIPAGQSIVLEAQWDVKAPSDYHWEEKA
ncbi:hypothetical protein BV20DRAFT_1050781 [Pilatotrama ljubarskyi]|nr:hypothetical protein BV20DRAFT_1050781 [Pilatotrama ljubarskyi]